MTPHFHVHPPHATWFPKQHPAGPPKNVRLFGCRRNKWQGGDVPPSLRPWRNVFNLTDNVRAWERQTISLWFLHVPGAPLVLIGSNPTPPHLFHAKYHYQSCQHNNRVHRHRSEDHREKITHAGKKATTITVEPLELQRKNVIGWSYENAVGGASIIVVNMYMNYTYRIRDTYFN